MIDQLVDEYQAAHSRLLLLDYDGVLAPIVARPDMAAPSPEMLKILASIAAQPLTKLVVISGRDHHTLEKWLGHLPIDLSAEHGHFDRRDGRWQTKHEADMSWNKDVSVAMEQLVRQYSGSHIETKRASLVWHYRTADTGVDEKRAIQLVSAAAGTRAIVMPGKFVVDVRALGADKGEAVRRWLRQQSWDFVMAIGDDVTDEQMFAALPESAWTIKVGTDQTIARERIDQQEEVVTLLEQLAE